MCAPGIGLVEAVPHALSVEIPNLSMSLCTQIDDLDPKTFGRPT